MRLNCQVTWGLCLLVQEYGRAMVKEQVLDLKKNNEKWEEKLALFFKDKKPNDV